MLKSSSQPSAQRKGSILMFAMIAAVIVAISVASFMSLSLSTMKSSDRSLHLHATINIAEAGVDEALWALNQYQLLGWTTTDPTAFTGWDVTGDVFTSNSSAKRSATPFSLGASTSAFSSLLSWGANTQRPTLAVRARYNMPGNSPVEKYIWCQLTRRSLFAAGLVARNEIVFSGNNVTVDSFKSANGAYTPAAFTNRFDNGSVASASVKIDSVSVGNADIYGRVATGGEPPDVGAQGRVGTFGAANGYMDPSRISTDFQANLDPLMAPDRSAIIAKASADPAAYQCFDVLPAQSGDDYVLGNASGAPTQYYFLAGGIKLPNKAQIKVQGPVVLVLSGALDASGNTTGINIDNTSSGITSLFHSTGNGGYALNDSLKPPLTIFSSGAIDLTGQGILNNPATSPYAMAAAVQIYGTSTTTQDISVKGNGVLCATVFAPNAAVTTVGNGDTYGSIVANTIKYTGNGAFHYDESLDAVKSGKWAIELWKELLTANERSGAWESKSYNF